MHRHLVNAVLFTALAATAAAGPAVISSPAAYASTQCVPGQNAGYSNGGSGDNYWGWCRPGGGSVRYYLEILCDHFSWLSTDWASGSGSGTIYTDAIYCPSKIDAFDIVNG